YKDNRGQVEELAKNVTKALKSLSPEGAAGKIEGRGVIARASAELKATFDSTNGGFSRRPKFPRAPALGLLLRHYHQVGEKDVLHMVTLTLDKMARGGIYDQLGGGFHRYSVDGSWLIPHFEKMLYDNALLAVIYLDAYQATKKPLYRRVAADTLDYVLRDMTDGAGGFHSAQDADSEGVEGKYYSWKLAEIKKVLPKADAELISRYYGVTAKGVAEGMNVLHVKKPLEEFARGEGIKPGEFAARLERMRGKLLAARAKRVPPGKDDKVLADWNGLMISALARGYQVLGEERYRAGAERAATFILAKMRKGGRLLHAYRAGKSHIDAFLDDYVFMTEALLDLYEATFDVKWLKHAEELARVMIQRFWDARGG
ncbi:MAG: thioredoxin domain-containing protein, partial [Planctomycetia bacterium]|nr:thioredoxin domain-containing protein [Planctomycetia bacterium]